MKKQRPPKWPIDFVEFFYKEKYHEQIVGDLYELFQRNGSRIKFIWNTIRFFRLRYLKGIDDYKQLTTLAMIKNHLKVAFRTLIRQKSYATINILGLSIGLAACFLIAVYVQHERSYDTFYPDADRIYRVANGERGPWTPPLLAETMMSEVSGVEYATRISGLWESLFQIGDRSFIQKGSAYGDPNMFKVFKTTFLSGDEDRALNEPNSIVLTQSLAEKCFPNEEAYGKTIVVDEINMKVTGVVVDPPNNTHFPYQYVISEIEPGHTYWTGNSVWTYAKINAESHVYGVNERLEKLYEKYAGPETLEWSGHDSFGALKAAYPDRLFAYTLYPMKDIHLHNPRFSMGNGGDHKNVVVFSLVALFILLIACVNYINMATARSALRSKEVGIRKALGSYKKDIISQFLVESLFITTIAVLLSILIAGASVDYFNELTGREFELTNLITLQNLLNLLILLIMAGFLAGLYPAYIMSGFSPLKALRGQKQQGGKRGLRSGLVAFQFAISIFLVAATAVIFKQVQFMQSHNLGLNTEQTLVVNGGRVLGDKYQIFKNEVEAIGGVEVVGKASNAPFHGYGDWTYSIPTEEGRSVGPYNAFVSADMIDVLDLEMTTGRFFDKELLSDTSNVVINESLAEELGWENPIGKELSRQGKLDFKIIGVMKNFNFTTLKHDIGSMIFRYGEIGTQEIGEHHQAYLFIKVSSKDILNTINEIEDVWSEHEPNYPLDAYFLDESFQRHYAAERKFGGVFTTFALLAVFIAFLGLFALTTFVLQKRFKEIAVRKVLGASIPSLLRMLLKEFTILVLIGGVVGITATFYWLNEWLEGYSYRIQVEWYLLALPILFVLTLTWIVVSAKSYKAAIANPANALKEE